MADTGYDVSTEGVRTDTPLDSSDFVTLGDLLESPTGETEPTYISGSGLRARTFEEVRTVMVERSDRLMRFGSEYVEAALAADKRRLVVDASELRDDLVQDMIAVLTSMCARLHGRRSARNRAKRALSCIEKQ